MVLVAASAAVIVALIYYPRFQSWRYMEYAEEQMEQEQWREAALWLEAILVKEPEHTVALRHMTFIARHLPFEDELLWWKRLLQLDRNNLNNRLGYVEAALRQGELLLAENLLNETPEAFLEDYQVLQLRMALARRSADVTGMEALARKILTVKAQDQAAELVLLESCPCA